MNKDFIRDIIDGYLTNHDIHRYKTLDEYRDILNNKTSEILNIIKELRENDIEVYHKIYDRSKHFQADIIIDYLDLTYNPKSIEKKKLLLNEMIQNNNNNDILIYEDIGIISGTIGIIKGVTTTAIGGIKTAAGLAGLSKMAIIHWPIALILLMILAITSPGKFVTKKMFKGISNVGSFFDSFGSIIKKYGKSMIFRYTIIQRNLKDCYKSAGWTEGDGRRANITHYLSVGNFKFPIGSFSQIETVNKLENCFHDAQIQAIGLLGKAYFNCLYRTGANVKRYSGNEILKIIAQTNISSGCFEYYKDFKEAFDKYYDLLDFSYGDYDVMKIKRLEKLKLELEKSMKRATPKRKQFQKN